VANFYPAENSRAREEQAAGTATFLKKQLGETKRRLQEQERRVGAFKKQHLGELPQQMQANLTTLDSLTARLRLTSDNWTRAAEHRQTIALQLAEAASFGPLVAAPGVAAPGALAAAALEAPSTRLARLRQQLSELRVRYTEQHPEVIRAKD